MQQKNLQKIVISSLFFSKILNDANAHLNKHAEWHLTPCFFITFHLTRSFLYEKPNLINILPHRSDFTKDRKYWGSNVQDHTLFILKVISSEIGQKNFSKNIFKSIIFVFFLIFFKFWFSHKFRIEAALTFAHGSKNLFCHIEFSD